MILINRSVDPSQASTYVTPQTLKIMGKAMLGDLILNNWDRIPLKGVWKNEGNGRNVMVKLCNSQERVSGGDRILTYILLLLCSLSIMILISLSYLFLLLQPTRMLMLSSLIKQLLLLSILQANENISKSMLSPILVLYHFHSSLYLYLILIFFLHY